MTHSATGTFYVTFGVQYATKQHPVLPAAHPDGWLEMRGVTEEQAHAFAHVLTGGLYASLYREGEAFPRDMFPRGAVYVLELSQP